MAKVDFPIETVLEIFMEAAEIAMKKVHLNIQQDIKKMLNLGGPGPPSAVGRPPHKQSGNLSRSWQYGGLTIRRGRADMTGVYKQARVGSAADYAAALEYGYPPRNLKARPYIRPVVRSKKKHKLGDKIFAKEFKKAAKQRANQLIRSTI